MCIHIYIIINVYRHIYRSMRHIYRSMRTHIKEYEDTYYRSMRTHI